MQSEMQKQKIRSFKDLEAWKQGHTLAIAVYGVLKSFPKEEQYGLADQMQRAAVSVPSNIAEGFGRQSLKEKIHFYSIARGSVTELQSQLLISRDVGYIQPAMSQDLEFLTITVHKLITGLIKSLRAVS